MSIDPSATRSLPVLLPNRSPPRKAIERSLRAIGVPALRAALDRRAERRAFEAALDRLAHMSPHLLEDIDLAMPPEAGTVPFPASTRGVASPFGVVPELPAGLTAARLPRLPSLRVTIERPDWNAPLAWMR